MQVNYGDAAGKTVYRFEGLTIDTQNFVVKRGDDAVTLTPRAFDVLVLLVRHAGQVVEKRQLFDEVWKDAFVSDNALTKIIKELRHALNDSVDAPRYIETVPKRGYRFIGKLDAHPEANGDDQPATSRSSMARWIIVGALVLSAAGMIGWMMFSSRTVRDTPTTIAVLPFKPLDSNSRDESLELGMAETLITRLSNLRDVVVRPIGSVRKFADTAQDPIKAGAELQTDAVLDGSIQKAGDRVRVAVRLVDVRTGSALWSEQFDESFTDIFKVQDSIAQRIASVLALRLSRTEQERLAKHMTDDPEAYELYLRGQFLWHRRGPDWINQSLKAYQAALEKDPNFALAHIGIADAYIMLSGHRRIGMAEAAANAEPNITRALEIDNSLAQAHNALAELKYQYQYDWQGAETEFRTAIDLNPNIAWIHQAYGWFLMSDGRFEEAANEMERARQLDPSSLTLGAARGRLYYYSRQFDRAIRHYQELIAQEPNDVSLRLALFSAYAQEQRYVEAVDQFLKIEAMTGAPPERAEELRKTFNNEGWEGFHRELLRELDYRAKESGRAQPWPYIGVYVQLKEKEKAFDWLERAAASRDVAMLQLKIDPAYDILRDDPRYAQLLAKIGQKP